MKDVSFGALQIYAFMIAIAATALLIPKDLEDRTLYTILAKPVPRLDYLLGKLVGVMLVIGGGLLILDAVFSLVLWIKQGIVVKSLLSDLQMNDRMRQEEIQQAVQTLLKQGLSWSMHLGVWAIFLKSSVLAALALLISTFASSTLFTIVSTFCFAVIGHGHGLFREYFFRGGADKWDYLLSALLSVASPDLTVFDVVENIIIGQGAALGAISTMTGIAAMYIIGYLVVTYLLFVEKEL
jgi:ABC-type transport system involved in multi-copper enzyme maturation permease subunit